MSQTLQLQSPAKLNLMLHITGRRDDGYHELQTVFQFIGLYDELTYTATPDGQIVRNTKNHRVAVDDDLIVKAALLLRELYRPEMGVEISINKHIPVGGGLGGGSSNAATTLMALNSLWRLGLSRGELQVLGRQLGADVPVFVFGRNAWAEGVGDKLTALEIPPCWYLVIHPQVFVSTAEIFASKDLTRDCHPLTIRAFLEGVGSNVCEPVACRLHAQIQQALDWLNQYGTARMTGTGACIYAAFDSESKALNVKSQVPEQWSGFVAKGLPSNPVADHCL